MCIVLKKKILLKAINCFSVSTWPHQSLIHSLGFQKHIPSRERLTTVAVELKTVFWEGRHGAILNEGWNYPPLNLFNSLWPVTHSKKVHLLFNQLGGKVHIIAKWSLIDKIAFISWGSNWKETDYRRKKIKVRLASLLPHSWHVPSFLKSLHLFLEDHSLHPSHQRVCLPKFKVHTKSCMNYISLKFNKYFNLTIKPM